MDSKAKGFHHKWTMEKSIPLMKALEIGGYIYREGLDYTWDDKCFSVSAATSFSAESSDTF